MMSGNEHSVQYGGAPIARDLTVPPGKRGVLAELEGIERCYRRFTGRRRDDGAEEPPCFALHNVNLSIQAGVMTALVGPSGSGKSTLLNVIAGIDRPTRGQLRVGGIDLVPLSEDELSRFRGRNVGIVFQFFQLLPTLTVVENVILPMDLVGAIKSSERHERARALLEQVGVADQASKLPTMLSGGQQQRVAIARALANDPPLVVCDEPTGNLDTRTAEQVLDVLSHLRGAGKTVVMATHERGFSGRFERTVTLEDGRIIGDADQEARKCTV